VVAQWGCGGSMGMWWLSDGILWLWGGCGSLDWECGGSEGMWGNVETQWRCSGSVGMWCSSRLGNRVTPDCNSAVPDLIPASLT
jgi:hypothetical protein